MCKFPHAPPCPFCRAASAVSSLTGEACAEYIFITRELQRIHVWIRDAFCSLDDIWFGREQRWELGTISRLIFFICGCCCPLNNPSSQLCFNKQTKPAVELWTNRCANRDGVSQHWLLSPSELAEAHECPCVYISTSSKSKKIIFPSVSSRVGPKNVFPVSKIFLLTCKQDFEGFN